MSDYSAPATVEREAASRKMGRYPLYVFFVLFAINVLNVLDRYIFTGASNVMGRELHLGIEQIGYLSSAFIVFSTISLIPFGIWADRAKRKNVIAIALTIWSLITSLTALANNFLTLFLSRMILGIGEAGFTPASQAMISDYFSRKKRARVMSWWAISSLVGIMAGTIIGGVVAGLYYGAWRLAFLFTGIPGLLLALVAWRLREPRRNQADLQEAEREAATLEEAAEGEAVGEAALVHVPENVFAQFKTLLRIKTMLVLIVVQIFSVFVISGTVAYLPLFLQQHDALNMTSAQAGLYSGLGNVLAGGVGMVLGGYLSDWLNRYYAGARVLVCGLSFLLSGPAYFMAVIVAVNMHDLTLYTVFFVIVAILLNMNVGPANAATQDVVPATLRASAVALSLFAGHILGDSIAPSLLGILARSFDPTGQHFAQGMAGHDLTRALLYVYPASLIVAGVFGIVGSRWMKADVDAMQRPLKRDTV